MPNYDSKILTTRDMIEYFVRVEDDRAHAKVPPAKIPDLSKSIAHLRAINRPDKSPLWRVMIP